MEINKLQQPYEQPHWRFSTAEYACSSWGRSRHTRHVDTALNDTCRIITVCLNATPIPCLYSLAGIAPFPHRAYAERLLITQIDASKKLIPDTHSMANALPSTASIQWELSLLNTSTQHIKTRCSYHIVGRGVEHLWWTIKWVAWQRDYPKWTLSQRHRRVLVHLEEFESAEGTERTMSGHDANWKLSQTDVTVRIDILCIILWHVIMPRIARGQTWLSQPLPVSTTGCQTLGGIYLTAAIEDSTKKTIVCIFAMLSLGCWCLLFSKALFINTNRPNLLHDILVIGLRHDEPASQAQNTVQSMRLYMHIESLHADFSYPHCWAAYFITIGLRVTMQRWTMCLGWLFHSLACQLFTRIVSCCDRISQC